MIYSAAISYHNSAIVVSLSEYNIRTDKVQNVELPAIAVNSYLNSPSKSITCLNWPLKDMRLISCCCFLAFAYTTSYRQSCFFGRGQEAETYLGPCQTSGRFLLRLRMAAQEPCYVFTALLVNVFYDWLTDLTH